MNPSQDYLDSLSHKIERNTLKEIFDHYDKIHEADYSEHLKQSAETLSKYTDLTSEQIIAMDLSLVEVDKLAIDALYYYQKRAQMLKDKEIAQKMKELRLTKCEKEFTIENVC